MHTVAQLMRKGHHIPRFSQIVQHDIGVDIRHRWMGECPRRLTRLHARVDPALVEERLGQARHFRIKITIGRQYCRARLLPADLVVAFHWQWSVPVPDFHRVQTQPAPLQFVIPVRQAGIGLDNGIAQRLDNLGLDMVRQMSPGLRRRHAAPAILDLFLLGQRVVDTGKQLDVLAKDARHLTCRRLSLRSVMIRQMVQRGFKAFCFAHHIEGQPGDSFVKQPVPRRSAHGRLVMQEFLKLIRQLIGPHGAHPVKNRLVARQIGMCAEPTVQYVILNPVHLKREEHQRCGKSCDPVLSIRHCLGTLGIRRVLIIPKSDKRHDPPADHVDLFVPQHTIQHRRRIQTHQLAFEIAGEIGAGLL